MEVYLKPIISACYVFPILAVIFTIPYILYEYHKYGSILILRTGIVYTFIFYMLTSYFMTVLHFLQEARYHQILRVSACSV